MISDNALPNLIDKIVSIMKPEVVEDATGKTYVFPSGVVKRVETPAAFDHDLQLGSVKGFCDHIKRFFIPDETTILCGTNGASADVNISGLEFDADGCTMPFYRDDLPIGAMSYEQFLVFLDRNTGNISGKIGNTDISEDEIREALKTIAFEDTKKITLKDAGASTHVTVEQQAGIQGTSFRIPKFVRVKLRYGLREYEIECRFRLTIDKDGSSFQLTQIPRDGAIDEYLNRVITDIRSYLGEEWHIVQGT